MSETRAESAEELLKRAAESLQQESARIQIQGKALTNDEKARLTKIEAAVDLINEAIANLAK